VKADHQGDPIGRIFAYWAVVFFGQFLKITKGAQILGLIIFTKTVLSYF
jgi:hypothetical protein